MDYKFQESDLLPGDALLYKPNGMFGWVIAVKTWHMVGHCEVYVGGGKTVASRNGQGVNEYDLKVDNLHSVHRPRPTSEFNILKALEFFQTVKGQKYDWKGLLRFASRKPYKILVGENEQFCSEFMTRFYRKGGLPIFRNEDADSIAPYQFALEYHFIDVTPSIVTPESK